MSLYDCIIFGLIIGGIFAVLCWSIGGLFKSDPVDGRDEHEDVNYANWQNTIPEGE